MTYADDELSRDAGEPGELFKFSGPQVGYFYTSGLASFEHDGDTYAPIAISRGSHGSTPTVDAAALTVTMPATSQVVIDYGFDNPPRTLELRIYRYQARSATYREIWRGVVVSIAPRGRLATLRVTSKVGDRLGTAIPSVVAQPTCNHFLFDERCRVDRATYDFTALISGVSGKTITLNSIGIAPDQWFRAGEIVRDLDGERRLIVDQVGAVVKLAAPFRTLANGDNVTLYAGCAHDIITCGDKFNNVVNFGGHPTMPSSNPFVLPLRLMRK